MLPSEGIKRCHCGVATFRQRAIKVREAEWIVNVSFRTQLQTQVRNARGTCNSCTLFTHQQEPHAAIFKVSYGELTIASTQAKEAKETFPYLLLGKEHTPNSKHARVVGKVCIKLLNVTIYKKSGKLAHETGPKAEEKTVSLQKNESFRLIFYLKLSATKITLLSSRREAKTRIV